MAQDDVIELSVVVNVANTNTAVVLHLEQNTSSPTGDPTEDVLDAWLASDIPTLWAARSADKAEMNCIKSQVIAPIRGVASFRSMSQFGDLGAEPLPASVGVQHSWQGDGWGRRQKGWHTWAGVATSEHHRNRLIQAAWGREVTFANRFNNVISAVGDYQFGVWSPTNGSIAILGFSHPFNVLTAIRQRRQVSCV